METLNELRKKPHWSFSALNTLANMCSLKWAFRYLYKVENERTSVNLLFGSAFHASAEYVARGRRDGLDDNVKEAQDIFCDYFTSECKRTENLSITKDEVNEHNLKGRLMMATLIENWTDRDVIGISKAFSIDIEGLDKPLIGEIDCIVRDENGDVVLIDWKSAARKWAIGKADKDLQATTFLMAYNRLAGFIPKFRFDVVTKAKTPTFTTHYTSRTDDDFYRLEYLLLQAQALSKGNIFLPNNQCFCCNNCEYMEACEAWHRHEFKEVA